MQESSCLNYAFQTGSHAAFPPGTLIAQPGFACASSNLAAGLSGRGETREVVWSLKKGLAAQAEVLEGYVRLYDSESGLNISLIILKALLNRLSCVH